jgi:hypothetical protein
VSGSFFVPAEGMINPMINPMAKQTNSNRALGILSSQKKKLVLTVSVFCRTKIISRTANEMMMMTFVFMVYFD